MAQLAKHADEVMSAIFSAARRLRQGMPENMGNNSRQTRDIVDRTRRTDSEMAGNTPRPKPDVDNPKPDIRPFTPNSRHDLGEFRRQLNEQWDAIRNMDLATWRRNRDAYADGRPSASEAAQRAERQNWRNRMEDELFDSHPEFFDADGNALPELDSALDDWMSTQAATHRLDGIAGGDVTDISGLGDGNVNSSLGSQWRHRIDALETAYNNFVTNNPNVDLSDVYFDLPDLPF
ncbi:polymorphic toxin type 15 domain-containing protein [uncultured Agrococcus sp.]|uniref:polymorphic toxin type 15 domain-containing protein n=1 Tax=uncultured Agrococcus sp. TaxID=382258 RepID=UPI0025DDBF08|nr:polymorphic toxin type 15 domain-containing protein [uncultured Agrococcus sp.]